MRTFAQKPKATQQTTSTKSTISGRAHFGQSREVDSMLHLQRVIGNQAVQRRVQTNAEELEEGSASTSLPRFAYDFSQIPVQIPGRTSPAYVQAKLRVSPPGDRYEQEAVRVSEHVMRMAEPRLQRVCACGGGCPTCQTNKQEHERLQAKRVQASETGQVEAPPIVHEVLHSPGQPLDPLTRAAMEQRFGHDFSRVRVHTDAEAAESAEAVRADAYTVGNDVVFRAGEFNPATGEGKRLLTHELAHVVQQSRGGPPPERETHAVESDAARAASEVQTPGASVAVAGASGVGMARQPQQGKQTPVEESDSAIRRQVQDAIDESEGDARGKVLLSIIASTRNMGRMNRWALELQRRRQSPYGNYLNLFFVKFRDEYQGISNKFQKMLLDEGIVVSPSSGGFESLEYIDPRKEAPANPALAKASPDQYVDNFSQVTYDLSYKPREPGILSEKLQVTYADGTKIDVDMWNINDSLDPAPRNSIWRSYIGVGGRVFPIRMAPNTTPRLWAEKQKALGNMEASNQEFIDFVSIALTGVMVNLPMGAIVGPTAPIVQGTRMGGTRVALAPTAPRGTTAATPKVKPPAAPGKTTTPTTPPKATTPPPAKGQTPPPAATKETVEEYFARTGKTSEDVRVKAGPEPKKITAQPRAKKDDLSVYGEGQELSAVQGADKRRAGMAAKPKHHVYPQEIRPWFKKRGFKGKNDIDRFTVELEEAAHQAIHGGGNYRVGRTWSNEWNQRVMRELFIAEVSKGKALTMTEIKNVVKKLMGEYGIKGPFKPYR